MNYGSLVKNVGNNLDAQKIEVVLIIIIKPFKFESCKKYFSFGKISKVIFFVRSIKILQRSLREISLYQGYTKRAFN